MIALGVNANQSQQVPTSITYKEIIGQPDDIVLDESQQVPTSITYKEQSNGYPKRS